jgi:TPR repeat protein/plasmid maintenance system antidote protein VapI
MRQIREQLNDAKAQGRWTVTRLAQRVGLGRTTVSNAFNGGPVSSETLACLAAPLQLDAQKLLNLLRQADLSAAEPLGDNPAADRLEPSSSDQGVVPLGRPISQLDPWDLEVHRAIDVAAGGSSPWPELPEYVQREHDRQLRRVIERAAAGKSQLQMLVGSSSTGKTRACWEAIQSLPDTWRLWHPIDPDRPGAALRDLERVRSHTVVWLNESQHYLLSAVYGEGIAAGLRTLLSDASRAPVLVLGTIWPEYHEELMREPGVGSPDSHSQTRHLLAGRDVAVPAQFDQSTVARLLMGSDPRLVAAATHAEDGMITQYLAGAPELLARYRRSTSGPRALIEAAMDARKLGHPVSLPLPFLAAAAEGYLTDTEWDLLPDNWLEQALAFLTEAVRGARGALTPVRRPRGAASSEISNVPAYRLADYLEQLGRAIRHKPAPKEFWMAAIRHCHGQKAEALAAAASRCGLMQTAFLLSIRADTPRTLIAIANDLSNAERLEEALPFYRRAINKGETYLIPFVAERLRGIGRHREAREWLQRATTSQHLKDPVYVAERMARQGRIDKALPLYQKAADLGDSFALRRAANRLVSAGRLDESLGWYERCGDDTSLHIAAYRLGQAGRLDEALTWYQKSAEAGNKKALRSAAHQLATSGRLNEALTWYERAAATNRSGALRDAADALALAGRLDHALQWYRRASEAGDPSALRTAGNHLIAAGRLDEAQRWYEKANETGDASALHTKAHRSITTGQLEESLQWYERAAATNKDLLWEAARDLTRAGHLDQALDWYSRAAEQGDSWALLEAAATLSDAGRTDDAVHWYERAARAGHAEALTRAGYCLATAHRLKEALRWFESAYEAGDAGGLHAAAHALASAGQLDESLTWYERAATAGYTESLCSGAVHLANAGRMDEALHWFESAFSNGHTHILSKAAKELLKRDRTEEAITWYHRAAMSGSSATYDAVRDLRKAERHSEAQALFRYGWDLDGRISKPWTASTQHADEHL